MSKNKLRCGITGLWYGVSAARRAKLIQKFGSEEALIEGYVSRDAIRLQKDGKSVDEIKALAEAGELKSNTAAPKKASTRAGVSNTKTKVTAPVDEEIEDTAEELDPDVAAFLGVDEDEVATADASSKAV